MGGSASKPLTIFVDTNVLIHGKALSDLPWKELGADDIEVVICGPVIRELDQLKTRPGRAGKVARALSTAVRGLLKAPGKSDLVRKSKPKVTRRLLLGGSASTPVRDGLDLNQGDQAIINQALTEMDAGKNVVLLTDDNFAAGMAEMHGLTARFLPEGWLKPPEGDNSAKALALKDAEIARLKATEPAPELWFENEHGERIQTLEATIKRYQPIAESDVNRLMQRIDEIAPIAAVQPSPLPSHLDEAGPFDPTLTEFMAASLRLRFRFVTQVDVDNYRNAYQSWAKAVRRQLAEFHAEWNRRRGTPRVVFAAKNEGSRPAESVLVEIECSGDFQVSGYSDDSAKKEVGPPHKLRNWLEIPLPPDPPTIVEQPTLETLAAHGIRMIEPDPIQPRLFPGAVSKLRRDDDAFYWRSGRDRPVKAMSLDCKTWRHQRKASRFDVAISSNADLDFEGLITGRVSATNLSEPATVALPVRVRFVDVETAAGPLIDDFELRFAQARAQN